MAAVTITELLRHIEDVVSPSKEDNVHVDVLFKEKVQKYSVDLDNLTRISEAINISSNLGSEPWWNYHNIILEKLLRLKELLISTNEKDGLLSVSQQKAVKAAFEMVVVLGIVNHLPKGIGIPLTQRSSLGCNVLPSISNEQKCHSLCLTVECIVSLRNYDTFKKIVSTHYLGDLLAGMFALLLSVESFDVSATFRAQVKKHLETLIEKDFQPNVIKELLLLYGNPECSARVARVYRGFLADRLMQKVGVVATMKAILDLTQGLSSPSHWKTATTLSKLILTPHLKDIERYRSTVYPQILQLVYANEVEYMQVAVGCVRQLYEKDPDACRKWFIDYFTKPFTEASSEDEVSQAIEGLNNCCGIPCSDNWALPVVAIREVHVDIFRLYVKTNSSIYHLKSKIKDIVLAIVKHCEPKQVFHSLLFQRGHVVFKFGDNGGIVSGCRKGEDEDEDLCEMGPEMLLEIIISMESADLKLKYFETAISTVSSDNLEVKLTSAKFLSELASDAGVQSAVNKNPKVIVEFVSELLKSKEQNIEITCVGLMVISVLLNDTALKSERNWSTFKMLVDPLKEFQSKTKNVEARVLAEELRSTILSHGVTITTPSKTKRTEQYNHKSAEVTVNNAIEEAVSIHIPIRAHGLMSLAKLIRKKDKDAWIKRDAIFCLFKENLKDSDSYVYLAAVAGLATLAASYPDEALASLIEQYRENKDPETRLKVGETLIGVVRLLNEMAVVYKGELIGAFLLSSQSEDPLIRASSLSNLGEVCKILGFRVQNYLVDILQLLGAVLFSEKHAEPRRAAVMVVTLLLQGLGKETFSTLQEHVVQLYRTLKMVLRTDCDDITKLHAEMALRELNSITMNFLMPPEKLQKRIYVLDSLPN